jgi:hypothetical protein
VSYSNPTTNPTGEAGDRRDLAQPALHDAPQEVCLGKDLIGRRKDEEKRAWLTHQVTSGPVAPFPQALPSAADRAGEFLAAVQWPVRYCR